MSLHYDITLKDLFQELPQQLLTLLWGAVPTELINLEFSNAQQRRPDIIAKLDNGTIHHLELQSRNDAAMEWRELEYYSLIYRQYGIAPIQQVLFVGYEKPRFTAQIQHERLYFHYELIDIRDLDGLPLLNSPDISDNILSLLTQLPNRRAAMQRLLHKINQLPKNHRYDKLTQLALLSGLRPLELPILLKEEKEAMSIQFDLMENPLFREQYEQAVEAIKLEVKKEYEQEIKAAKLETKLAKEEKLNALKTVAENMYQEGQGIDKIAQVIGLSETEIKRLLH